LDHKAREIGAILILLERRHLAGHSLERRHLAGHSLERRHLAGHGVWELVTLSSKRFVAHFVGHFVEPFLASVSCAVLLLISGAGLLR
jgi:hypothetical protein